MRWLQEGTIAYDEAVRNATNPSEFALRVSGISAASDRTFNDLGR
ncbi:MAG: hypothetical protein V9E87_02145 [Gemmatimonadales bacterium]